MIQSPETIAKIASWKAKQAAGLMTPDDWKEAMLYLRGDRTGRQTAGAVRRTAAAKAPVDVGALKDSLRALARKP